MGDNDPTVNEAVACRGQIHILLPDVYWHLTCPGNFLLHNARLGQGLTQSVSAVADFPGLQNAVSPYGIGARSNPKEQEWERVRLTVDNALPTRLNGFFVFETEGLAQRAQAEWFGEENRTIVRVRAVEGASLHRADARLLDSSDSSQWDDRATMYWRGDMTDDPRPEIIVKGPIYFPDWETFTVQA